jgi:hypothetical protein
MPLIQQRYVKAQSSNGQSTHNGNIGGSMMRGAKYVAGEAYQ